MVTDPTGHFLTQRQAPRLALVDQELTSDRLILRTSGMRALELPLLRPVAPSLRSVQVWDFEGTAADEGNRAADWFSHLLERPARLVRWRVEERRLSPLDVTKGVEAENRFSDGYPLLVLSEASVADLNFRRLHRPALPVDRFRPNLLLSGTEPYAEDAHATLRLGTVELALVSPCPRCQITTTNQKTAEVDGKDPLQTLATYRHDPAAGGVIFGQNAIVLRGHGGMIRVGMEVEFLGQKEGGKHSQVQSGNGE